MPGPGHNFFGRLPGPFPVGPGTPQTPDLPSIPLGYTTTTLVRTPLLFGRQTRYKLRPPTVVNLPPFLAIRVYLADQKHPPRKTNYRLGNPVVVHPPLLTAKVKVTLAPSVVPSRRTHSKLFGPTVVTPLVGFVAAPVRVTFSQFKRPPRGTIYRLSSPVVVTPRAALAHPIRVTLAPSRRPKTRFRLAPPTVLATPTPFLAAPIRRTLAKAELPRRGTLYKLGSPVFVHPVFVPPPAVVTGVDDITPILPTMM